MDTALRRYDKRYFSEQMSKLTIGEIALGFYTSLENYLFAFFSLRKIISRLMREI